MVDVVVVGAGLAGLACARALSRARRSVVVLDRADAPGGVVGTHRIDGFLVESGPNTLLPTPGALEVVREAGLAPEMLSAPGRLPRFVYVGGRLRRAPWVLTARGWLRALGEPLVAGRRESADESVASFFARRFGSEVHERLAAPFVGGIYAGSTGELGIEGTFPTLADLERRYRSVLYGFLRSRPNAARPRLTSFREGMAALPRGLAAGIDIRLGASDVRAVGLRAGGWEVRSSAGTFPTRAVVLAVPAYSANRCLEDAGRIDGLDEVDYVPVVVAAAALDLSQLDREVRGFGFLVPREEGLHLLGALFSSNLFPGRAPDGKILLTTFLGGAHDRGAADWPDARVWATIEGELRRVLGFRDAVCPLGLFRYRRGIPQYRVGHHAWRERVGRQVAMRQGLFLTGNYLDGVSVPSTLEHGLAAGRVVHQYLERSG